MSREASKAMRRRHNEGGNWRFIFTGQGIDIGCDFDGPNVLHIAHRSRLCQMFRIDLDITCFNGCYGRWNSRCFLCPFKCIRESKVKYQKHGDKYMAGALLTAYALHEVQLRV